MYKLEKNECTALKTDINSFPVILSYASIPLRKDSKGFSDDGRRYTINAGGVDLELIAGSKIYPIPTGKIGRSVFAYIASKVVRQEFRRIVKNYFSSEQEALKRIEQIQFSLRSLTEITKEILNLDRTPSNRERNQVYEQLCGVLNLGIVYTPIPNLNYYDFPNERFFLTKQFNISKLKNGNNYIIFTCDGFKFFFRYVIPIVYKDYIELNSIEQDLYVYLIRKTRFPEKLEPTKSTIESLRKEIKVNHIVKQIFNCNFADKHYKDNEDKLHNAYKNIIQKFPDFFWGAMWNEIRHTLMILPNKNDPAHIEGQKQILIDNRFKASLILQQTKKRKQRRKDILHAAFINWKSFKKHTKSSPTAVELWMLAQLREAGRCMWQEIY